MSSLFLNLPSFATDYSGFISALHGFGGLMVIHDPSGCLGNYTNCDEPRWYAEPQPVCSTTIRELEAVTGDTKTVTEKIIRAAQELAPKFICIFMTPVPALTGCDIQTIAEAVESAVNIRCFGIPTTGFKLYDDGIKKAMDFIYDKLTEPPKQKRRRSVNLLGMTPLDYFIGGEDEKLIGIISDMGWSINSRLGMGGSLEELRHTREAEKNIVMTMAALPMAQRMLACDGIPVFVGPPCGSSGVAGLHEFLTDEPTQTGFPGKRKEAVLIIGEQACANALRRSLRIEQGFENVDVASFFEIYGEQGEKSDVYLESESALRKLFLKRSYDIIIGDPLFHPLCPPDAEFVARPHPAVSSKLHWKEYKSLIG